MKTRIIKGEWEKKTEKGIKMIKKFLEYERKEGLEIFIDKNVETMIGKSVDNVYLIDKMLNGKVIYQKHLFTV